MAIKSRVKRKSGRIRSGDAADKDAIAELKKRIAVLENELRLFREGATLPDMARWIRAEEALRKSEEKYRGLAEEINDWICDVDEYYVCTYSSSRVRNVLGYEPEEVIGRSAFDFMRSSEVDRLKAMIDTGFNPGNGFDLIQCQLLRKDDHAVWIEISGKPVMDSHGKFKCNRGLIRDITERKRSEEALRESEEKFRQIAESVGLIYFLVSPDCERLFYVNSTYERITGLDIKDVYGNPLIWLKLLPPEDSLRVLSIVGKLRGGEIPNPEDIELHFRRPDGRLGWVTFKLFAVRDRDGGIPRIAGIVEDVTERKQAEEALKEAKSQAELYVDLMGHDINNMNQISMGFVELAHNIIEINGKLGSDNIALLDKAMDSLKNSSQLIDNVRKLQREKMGLYEPESIDIGKMIRGVVEQFQSIPGRNIRITCDFIDHCLVRANSLLKDVFVNLIGNSVKHSQGDLTISIRVSQVIDQGSEYYRVDVEDDGPGISDQLKVTLFDRLNLKATRTEGKGFGLCLIKMLVDGYDGKFWAEDRVPGDHTKGARFVVMLPAVGE